MTSFGHSPLISPHIALFFSTPSPKTIFRLAMNPEDRQGADLIGPPALDRLKTIQRSGLLVHN
jgi:hypothetical protein